MDDRRIDNLLRMVSEIDELERSAMSGGDVGARTHGPTLRVVDRQHAAKLRKDRRAWFVRSTLLAAAAACLGFVVRLSLPTPAPVPSPGPGIAHNSQPSVVPPEKMAVPQHGRTDVRTAIAGSEPRDHTAAALPVAVRDRSPEASVVLAIFEDATGAVRCVRWREHDFGAKGIEGVHRNDLLAATYGDSCVVGPHQLIAVGLSGPRDKLPTTEAGVQAVAQCIVGGRPTCESSPAAAHDGTMSCVPTGLKMMVETLAMGK